MSSCNCRDLPDSQKMENSNEDEPPSTDPSPTTPSRVDGGHRNGKRDTCIPIWLFLRSKPSLIGHIPDNNLLRIRQY